MRAQVLLWVKKNISSSRFIYTKVKYASINLLDMGYFGTCVWGFGRSVDVFGLRDSIERKEHNLH